MLSIDLAICGCTINISTPDRDIFNLLGAGYGAMAVTATNYPSHLRYSIRYEGRGCYRVERSDTTPVLCATDHELLYHFEKDVTLELQRLRPDLFFLHAGVVEHQGQAILFAASSGTGKSTLCYALLHQGFAYLSDELAPVDLDTMQVHPYPHALCMKTPPPLPYVLPADVIVTQRTLHIPVSRLPSPAVLAPTSLALVLLIHRQTQASTSPTPRLLKPAEAATRLYVNVLNALAHPADGLDAALTIAARVPCFELDSSFLTRIGPILDNLLATPA